MKEFFFTLSNWAVMPFVELSKTGRENEQIKHIIKICVETIKNKSANLSMMSRTILNVGFREHFF